VNEHWRVRECERYEVRDDEAEYPGRKAFFNLK